MKFSTTVALLVGAFLPTASDAFVAPRAPTLLPATGRVFQAQHNKHPVRNSSCKPSSHVVLAAKSSNKLDPPVEDYMSETMMADNSNRGKVDFATIVLGGTGLLLFAGVSYYVQDIMNRQCVASPAAMCDPQVAEWSAFFEDHSNLAFLLIFTHALPFALIPTTMALVNKKGDQIKADNNPTFNPFVMTLGLATICFGLALEFGWHVTSAWYYVNNFHVLNFGFYFFLISSFAIWADGFGSNCLINVLMGGILLMASILYPVGYAHEAGMMDIFDGLPLHLSAIFYEAEKILTYLTGVFGAAEAFANLAKVPLYAGLTVTFLVLSYRGYKVFGPAMLWVPFFSVGVNLFFIAKLEALHPTPLVAENYWYHIGHDLLGTEAGVAFFAYLVAVYPQFKFTPKDSNELKGGN